MPNNYRPGDPISSEGWNTGYPSDHFTHTGALDFDLFEKPLTIDNFLELDYMLAMGQFTASGPDPGQFNNVNDGQIDTDYPIVGVDEVVVWINEPDTDVSFASRLATAQALSPSDKELVVGLRFNDDPSIEPNGQTTQDTYRSAIEFVQSAGAFGNAGAVNSVAYPSNVTEGNTLFVVVATGATFETPTDTQGNTYSLVNASDQPQVYRAKAISTGANTVTITPTGGQQSYLVVLEYRYAGTGVFPDKVANSGSGTSLSTGSVPISRVKEMILVAFIGFINGGTDLGDFSGPSGYDVRYEDHNTAEGNSNDILVADKIGVDASENVSISLTSGSARGWEAVGLGIYKFPVVTSFAFRTQDPIP